MLTIRRPARQVTLLLLAATLTAARLTRADAPATQPAAPAMPGISVTIYSSADPAGFDPQQFIYQQRNGDDNFDPSQIPGFGVVRQTEQVNLQPGANRINITNVAAFIDPTTVSISDLTDPQTAVLDQQFKFDLVSPSKLLGKYIDQSITVIVPQEGGKTETVTGTLLSNNQGSLVLQTADGLRLFNQSEVQLKLGKLPDGLITRPTLQLNLQAANPPMDRQLGDAGQLMSATQPHTVRVAYQTSGLTWRADYNVLLDDTETKADISAWVTLLNLSGTTYNNATLKLIAGDVQRVQPPRQVYRQMAMAFADKDQAGAAPGFEEKSFFEYHLYTLPRPADIIQNATQQIALFPAATDVGVTKTLVYYGLGDNFNQYWTAPSPVNDRNLGNDSNKKVDVYFKIANEDKNHLGKPLPKGKVRVYKKDPADGSLEFVGEDLIDHTPNHADILIKLGQSFDVTGQRTQTDFTIDEAHRVITESIKITLKNAKKDPQDVIVKENLFRWANWEITQKSDNFDKIDSRTIHFPVTVPAEGTKEVTYTVKYTW
jgi:hypothetical protein